MTKAIHVFAPAFLALAACVEAPHEPSGDEGAEEADVTSVEQAIDGSLFLSLSSSDREKSTNNSAAKVRLKAVKHGIQFVDVIAGNYSSGSNARTYDMAIRVTLRCPGVGPSFPPHSLQFFVNTALDAGETHFMTRLTCDTVVPPGKGFEVSASLDFEQWACNPLSCN
jgi:hypothetical protein